MRASVLLDTSFLISLVNAKRPHHLAAARYYQHMLQNNVPMYFSAIVASEFGIKQDITDLPLGNFRPLNFNVPHGQKAAHIWNQLGSRDPGDSRSVARDDVKLIAQASHEAIGVILTEDENTLHKYCERLRKAGHIQTRAIKLASGFDANVIRENGQAEIVFPNAAPESGS
ncbi:MAG: PIN domain-containing protein [Burkholderiaceae bacterium]|jgi:predicted nucleic acid-binding protein|nr:PIN domain-containing protein [Burkholderiaceae bacterium]